jgi:hypothetical protein
VAFAFIMYKPKPKTIRAEEPKKGEQFFSNGKECFIDQAQS